MADGKPGKQKAGVGQDSSQPQNDLAGTTPVLRRLARVRVIR
jgi:hypothetical protein